MCEAEAGAQLMCEAEAGPNVAQFLNEIKHETVDDDLENLDPGFLQVKTPDHNINNIGIAPTNLT